MGLWVSDEFPVPSSNSSSNGRRLAHRRSLLQTPSGGTLTALITTQLEPDGARRIMPVFDDPAYKVGLIAAALVCG